MIHVQADNSRTHYKPIDSHKYWQINFRRPQNTHYLKSGHRPTPFGERTYPEITVMLRTDLVPTQIE